MAYEHFLLLSFPLRHPLPFRDIWFFRGVISVLYILIKLKMFLLIILEVDQMSKDIAHRTAWINARHF